MSERNRDTQWPPAQLAVLQNGDGSPSYYRPREANETLDTFIKRIAGTVVRGIIYYPYTAFVEIVAGASGETDEALTVLVIASIEEQRLARQE